MNKEETREEMWMIEDDVHFGLRDVHYPCIWFAITNGRGIGALQVIVDPKEIEAFLKSGNCYDIANLKNRAIICEVKGGNGGTVKFKKFV